MTRTAQAVPQFKQAIKAVEELSAELLPNKRIAIGTGMLGDGDGVAVSTKDVHAIGLSPTLAQGPALHTALHELGHVVYHEQARNVPPAILAKVDAEFFAGSSLRTNFICGIGRGDPGKVFDRLSRLTFDEVATVV